MRSKVTRRRRNRRKYSRKSKRRIASHGRSIANMKDINKRLIDLNGLLIKLYEETSHNNIVSDRILRNFDNVLDILKKTQNEI